MRGAIEEVLSQFDLQHPIESPSVRPADFAGVLARLA